MAFHDGPFGRLRGPLRPSRTRPDPGPRSRPDLPRGGAAAPRGRAGRRDRAGRAAGARRHRRQPDHRLPRTRPGAGRAGPPRRARGGRRRRRRAVRARDPRAPRHRPARAGRRHASRRRCRSDRRCRRRARSSPPGAERRPAWWIVAELARRMGLDLLGGADPAGRDDETHLRALLHGSPIDADDLFAAGPHGLPLPVEHGWVTGSMLPDGRWRIAPADAGGAAGGAPGRRGPRRSSSCPVGRWGGATRSATAAATWRSCACTPTMPGAAGLADGDEAEVRSEHGELVATVARRSGRTARRRVGHPRPRGRQSGPAHEPAGRTSTR